MSKLLNKRIHLLESLVESTLKVIGESGNLQQRVNVEAMWKDYADAFNELCIEEDSDE